MKNTSRTKAILLQDQDSAGTWVSEPLASKIMLLSGLLIATAALIFIAISITIAMLYGDGKILIDFNSIGEAYLELAVTVIAIVIIINQIRHVTKKK